MAVPRVGFGAEAQPGDAYKDGSAGMGGDGRTGRGNRAVVLRYAGGGGGRVHEIGAVAGFVFPFGIAVIQSGPAVR